jgi:polyisoprenoid-binding protein YceI
MSRNLIAALALSSLGVLAALPAQAAEVYAIDPAHSEVSFQVRHLVTQVRGKFSDYQGTIQLDPAKLENSKVELRIKAASIDTALPDRDKHLRSEDFFFVDKYPEITFTSQQIKATGKDTYEVTGPLTLRGVTRTVTLPVTYLGKVRDPWGNDKAGFALETTINRKDYGIVWNAALDNGGVVLGDDVKIAINLETQLQKDAAKKGK